MNAETGATSDAFTMQLRPADFAAYSAFSAPRRNSAFVSPCSGDVAMPMERVGGGGAVTPSGMGITI